MDEKIRYFWRIYLLLSLKLEIRKSIEIHNNLIFFSKKPKTLKEVGTKTPSTHLRGLRSLDDTTMLQLFFFYY
jgi:hypothetical protein